MRIVFIASVSLLAAACSPRQQTFSDEAVAVETISPVAAGDPATSPTSAMPLTAPQVAYVYRYGLEAPASRTADLMTTHEQACLRAGPTVCQVIASESRRGEGEASARLELRATPVWISRFRNGVDGDAKAVGGKVAEASVESEDLTRSLIDIEARLRAQTTLRDRLQQVLATRDGNLEQLLKVENELARVQGEIDSVQSSLVVLRTRVATSRLEVRYESRGGFGQAGPFAPLREAWNGALLAFMTSLGFLVTLFSVLTPVMLVLGPLGWLALRYLRRRNGRPLRPVHEKGAAPDDATP